MTHAHPINIIPTINAAILNCPMKNGTTSEARNTSPADVNISAVMRN